MREWTLRDKQVCVPACFSIGVLACSYTIYGSLSWTQHITMILKSINPTPIKFSPGLLEGFERSRGWSYITQHIYLPSQMLSVFFLSQHLSFLSPVMVMWVFSSISSSHFSACILILVTSRVLIWKTPRCLQPTMPHSEQSLGLSQSRYMTAPSPFHSNSRSLTESWSENSPQVNKGWIWGFNKHLAKTPQT